jgi:hypothetical protein
MKMIISADEISRFRTSCSILPVSEEGFQVDGFMRKGKITGKHGYDEIRRDTGGGGP